MSALAPRRSQAEVKFSDNGGSAARIAEAQSHIVHVSSDAPATPQVVAGGAVKADAGDTGVHHVRLSFDTIVTPQALAKGSAVARINDPLAIFQDSTTSEEQLQHAIVTGVTVNGIMSDCPEAVMLSLKLFDNDKVGQIQNGNSSIGIRNQHGWLFSNNSTEFGAGTSSEVSGFSNMMSIFPYERSRPCTKVYDPSGVQNNRFIETYGGYNGAQLWDDIIAFPKENFYFVHKDHVVMSVIRNNWDSLGINPQEEVLHQNKYYKLSSALVDHVINKLQNDVLSTIPFTDLTNLQVKYTAKPRSLWAEQPDPQARFKIVTELKISYMFPKSV